MTLLYRRSCSDTKKPLENEFLILKKNLIKITTRCYIVLGMMLASDIIANVIHYAGNEHVFDVHAK